MVAPFRFIQFANDKKPIIGWHPYALSLLKEMLLIMWKSRIQRMPRSSAKRIMSTILWGAGLSILLNKTMEISTNNEFLIEPELSGYHYLCNRNCNHQSWAKNVMKYTSVDRTIKQITSIRASQNKHSIFVELLSFALLFRYRSAVQLFFSCLNERL